MAQRNRSLNLRPANSRAALTITHSNATGIDIGSATHFVAVPPDRDDEPVREFPSFTVDLNVLADWLKACGIDTVAMESTGVYWIPLFELGKERTIESFEKFFTLIGQEQAEKILTLTEKHCTNALNILDRFQVVAKLNKALDEVRTSEAKKMVQDGYEPVLKKSRWCLLKKPENLTDHQRVKLRKVLRYNLKSVRAYLHKKDFQRFWKYESPVWAGKFLDQCCRDVMRSKIDPLKKFVGTLRNHRELLLNYSEPKKTFSSGVVEGLNNKAKVTMRNTYGYKTYEMLKPSLYHALGKLLEPQLNHRFF